MSFKLVPRGWETSITTGTGALTLAGAVTNYPNTGDTWRAFSADLSNNDTTYYAAVNRSVQTEWEEGIGTWGTGGILTRTTIIRSSNSNNAVSFTAGTLDVMCTPITPAAVPYNASANQLLLSGAGAVPTWSGSNLSFVDPVLTVGSGTTTSTGFQIGYASAVGSGFAALYATGITPSSTNYALLTFGSANTYLNAGSALALRISGNAMFEIQSNAFRNAAGNKLILSLTAPTIGSGFGTSPSIVASNGSIAFTVNVGTGGTASSGVITMPAAATGWAAKIENLTAVAANRADQRTVVTATTTTSITVQNQTISTGAALAWTASDVLQIMALAY